MRRFCIQDYWCNHRFLIRPHHSQSKKLLCTSTSNTNKVAGEATTTTPSIRDYDAYRQLDKLDFMTSAKMLFTTPTKKKKFGLDFHLVQLFFCCMPSLAVYLVAQYARYEIKRMEAEVEVKKMQEEEEKAKEMEAKALEEAEAAKSDPELLKVKVRLEALEEAIKEIAVESKKQSTGSIKKGEESTKKEKLDQLKSENKPEGSSKSENKPEGSSKSENKQESSRSAVDASSPASQTSSASNASIPDKTRKGG